MHPCPTAPAEPPRTNCPVPSLRAAPLPPRNRPPSATLLPKERSLQPGHTTDEDRRTPTLVPQIWAQCEMEQVHSTVLPSPEIVRSNSCKHSAFLSQKTASPQTAAAIPLYLDPPTLRTRPRSFTVSVCGAIPGCRHKSGTFYSIYDHPTGCPIASGPDSLETFDSVPGRCAVRDPPNRRPGLFQIFSSQHRIGVQFSSEPPHVANFGEKKPRRQPR